MRPLPHDFDRDGYCIVCGQHHSDPALEATCPIADPIKHMTDRELLEAVARRLDIGAGEPEMILTDDTPF